MRPMTPPAPRPLVEVTIPGEPVPKARPRVTAGRAYTPRRTQAAERAVAWALRLAMGATAPVTDSVDVCVHFRCGADRADLDNLVKLVLDAANGIVWRDDRQVVSLTASKATVRDRPGTWVEVWTRLATGGTTCRRCLSG